jgi:hypothetical protein
MSPCTVGKVLLWQDILGQLFRRGKVLPARQIKDDVWGYRVRRGGRTGLEEYHLLDNLLANFGINDFQHPGLGHK